MTKQEIFKAGEQAKKEGITIYYTYWSGRDKKLETIVSNFDPAAGKMTDNRLKKLVEAGILNVDWDVYTVI